MLAAKSPPPPLAGGDQIQRPRITPRKPLQPTNPTASAIITNPNRNYFQISTTSIDGPNKENPHLQINPTKAEPIIIIDGSLAEELSAVKRKMERLREEREMTEGVMRERGLVMEREMEELVRRGELQKMLENEVDRLFRLKELKSLCKRNSSVRSLREKEYGGKSKEGKSQSTSSGSTCTSE